MTKSQVFFWLLIAFGAGIAVASFVPLTLSFVWACFVVGAIVASYGVVAFEERKRAVVIGCAIILAAFGMFRFLAVTRAPDSLFLTKIGTHITEEGIVDEEPTRSLRNQRLVVRAREGDLVLLVTGFYPEYHYGDRISFSGELKEPENFEDSTFDYRAYLAKDDIFSMISFPRIELLSSDQGSKIFSVLLGIKAAFAEKLNRSLPEPQASFMAGLILGEKRSLPAEITSELRATGTSHIVALSGYNITIIGDAMMKTLAFASVPFSWAFASSVVGILAFTLVTGAEASVVRASIMGILVLVARRFGRQYQIRNALAFAGVMMLLQNPRILRFDVGFELSFLATLGIVYGSGILDAGYEKVKLKFIPYFRDARLIAEDRQEKRPSRKSFLREVLITTLSAQLFVIPTLVRQFGTLSLVSPFANLAVLPLIPATMFFGFCTAVISFFSGAIGQAIGWISWLFLSYELGAISFFAKVPYAAIDVSGIALGIVGVLYLLVIFFIWKKSRHARS